MDVCRFLGNQYVTAQITVTEMPNIIIKVIALIRMTSMPVMS